jgi:hypothetical protein
MASWMDYMMNPRTHHLKKAMYEILKERYGPHDQILERVSSSLVTESDIQDFFKLITSIYETAYLKAVNDHSDALTKLGLHAKVVSDKN